MVNMFEFTEKQKRLMSSLLNELYDNEEAFYICDEDFKMFDVKISANKLPGQSHLSDEEKRDTIIIRFSKDMFPAVLDMYKITKTLRKVYSMAVCNDQDEFVFSTGLKLAKLRFIKRLIELVKAKRSADFMNYCKLLDRKKVELQDELDKVKKVIEKIVT